MNTIAKGVAGVAALGTACTLGLIALIATQPGELTVSRSIDVIAAPSDMRPYARDMKKWEEWSPWSDIDPNVQQTFSDPSAGLAATYAWEGNDEVGKGMMTIEVDEAGKTVHRIDFEKPFAGVATSTVTWKGTDTQTTVTWTFRQQADFGTKAANLFMDIEGMLGKDYDKGLALLKPIVETAHTERLAAEKRAAEKLATEKAAENEPEALSAESGAKPAAPAMPPG